MLNYSELEAFVAVIEEKGFFAASKRLGITQPAVSKRVKNLEDAGGQPLLSRTTPPQPTAAGERLMAHFYQVKLLEKGMWDLWRPRAEDPNLPMPVPISLNSESLSTWFLEATEKTVKEKKLLLQLVTDDQDLAAQYLRRGSVLGAVTSEAHPPHGCRSRYLGTMNYACVASPRFKTEYFPKGVSKESLRYAPAAIYGKSDRLHEQYFESLGERIVAVHPPYHFIPSPQGLIEITVRGLAYAVLPVSSIPELLKAGKLVELFARKRYQLKLYWQTVDFNNPLLEQLSKAIECEAKTFLS